MKELRKWNGKITEQKIRKNYSYVNIRFPVNECRDLVGKEITIQEVPGGFDIRLISSKKLSQQLQQSSEPENINERLKSIENNISLLAEAILTKKGELSLNNEKSMDLAGFEPAASTLRTNTSLNSIFKANLSDFNNYLLRVRRVTEKKAITYLAAWKMIPEIKDLSDLSNARLNENQTISFRNFLHFLQDVKCVESVNGFKIDKWLTLAKIHRGLPKLTFINSKDVYEGFKNCPEELKTFYKLLAYSGGRGEHLKKMIETFEPDRVIFSEEHPGVCAYPVTELCSGNKNIFFVYFPTEFLKELRDYCLPDLHIHTIYKSIRCGNVSTKNLRKWHANLFLTNGVQESALDFIHGRTPRSVVAKFYTNLNMQACRAYAETINKFPIFD